MNKLFKMFGLTRVFEDAAAAGDTNNSNASGGDEGNKGGGGGGDNTANKDNKPAEDKTVTHELNINGEIRRVTTEEMRVMAQKSGAVDKGFEDIATQRKSNEDAIRMKELVDRISSTETPTEADAKELAVMLGVKAEDMAEYLDGGATLEDEMTPGKIDPIALAEALGMKPENLKMTGGNLARSYDGHVAAAKKDIRDNSDIEVDKDAFFGKIKIGNGGDGIIGTVKDLVAEDVLRKIQDGTPYGADLVAASIQKIRAHLVKMGIPGKPDKHLLGLGLIPGGGLPSEVTSETPIERIDAGKEGAEDNFVSRYMQKGLKMIRDNAVKQK